jgi:DedD protein
MEQHLKQRLVGAAVLVALAVILVPMVLDGGYRPPLHMPRKDMAPMPQEPAAPDIPHLPGEVVQEIDDGFNAPAPTLEATASAGKPLPPVAVAPPPPPPQAGQAVSALLPPPKPKPQPRPAEPPKEKPLAPVLDTAKPKASPSPAEAPPPKPAPAAADQSEAGERWAVQLGSFSSKENAELLVRRLQASGVAAHMTPVKDAHGLSFRVRAGPVNGRAAALDLRTKLAKSPDLRGILVRE